MTNLLITGTNSYVGDNVSKWLSQNNSSYNIESIDMKNINWKNTNFSNFDTIFHVAGIAHVSTKKV